MKGIGKKFKLARHCQTCLDKIMTDGDNSKQFYETENNYCFQKPSSKSSFFCLAFEINNYI